MKEYPNTCNNCQHQKYNEFRGYTWCEIGQMDYPSQIRIGCVDFKADVVINE